MERYEVHCTTNGGGPAAPVCFAISHVMAARSASDKSLLGKAHTV
jgi:hypothetical protein